MNRTDIPSTRRSAITALTLTLVGIFAVAGWVAAPTHAQVPDPMFQDFEPVGSFALSVDGAAVPKAEIFQSERASAILVMTSKLDSPVMVNLRSRQVEEVSLMSLAKRPDGTIDILADAPIQSVGTFAVQETGITFSYGGKQVALTTRESLTGEQSAAALLEYDPSYARGADSYEPNSNLVAELEKRSEPIRVQVFFNSKCGVCKEMVPRIIKLERTLDADNIEFDYYGVPDSYSGDDEMDRKDVSGVPTGIVYVNGREVGRIVGGQWRIPELAIKNLLIQKG
jgi:thiol-disulfide isomerase/thioredoxin